MATIEQTLAALAAGDETGSLRVPLDERFYPIASVEATAELFRDQCRVEYATDDLGGARIVVTVLPICSDDRRTVLGRFQNALIVNAVRCRARQAPEETR